MEPLDTVWCVTHYTLCMHLATHDWELCHNLLVNSLFMRVLLCDNVFKCTLLSNFCSIGNSLIFRQLM